MDMTKLQVGKITSGQTKQCFRK